MADDILDLWHSCLSNNAEVKQVNNEISFDGRLYSKDLETCIPVKTPKDQESSGRKYYTIGEIFFFLENRSLPHPTYFQMAKEKGVGCIRRPDRKAILDRLAIGTSRPTLRSSKSVIEEPNADSLPKKIKLTKTNVETEPEKSRVRTYSRKKPVASSRSFMKRQSTSDQSRPPSSSNGSFNEVSALQAELQTQQHIVGSMSAFLRDFLGLTSSQLEILQSDQYKPSDLKQIASIIQSQCSCSCKHNKTQSCHPIANQEEKKNSFMYCYKAEKHPSRGWEIVKKELSSVLNGTDSYSGDAGLDSHHRAALEACLNKAATPLKHALSILISQMREFNKSPNSFEEADIFCQKIIRDCLVNAVDSFRDAFQSLFQTLKGSYDGSSVDKWVSVCETELRKLLLSLVKSLLTLRDIPPKDSRNSPSTLFHFPEPVLSLALNPAKLTHSVVLEMYIKIGLAELRHIIVSSVDSPDDSCSHEGHCNEPESAPHTTSLIFPDIKQELQVCESFATHSIENAMKPGAEKDTIPNEDIYHSKDLLDSSASRHSAPELDQLFPVMNGNSRNSLFKNTSCQARRSSESDSCHYSMFKASLGNTMVSSFKKQIQEKIQAGSSY